MHNYEILRDELNKMCVRPIHRKLQNISLMKLRPKGIERFNILTDQKIKIGKIPILLIGFSSRHNTNHNSSEFQRQRLQDDSNMYMKNAKNQNNFSKKEN